MPNPGIAPPQAGTPVGDFRAAYPDTQYVPLVPPVSGMGDYEKFSDASIESFLAMANGSIFRAVGYALLQQANTAASESESVADYDLRIDLTKKAADLRAQAQFYFDLADDSDAGDEDAFIITPIGDAGRFIPELSVPIWGRRYVWDRWL